MPTPIKNFLPVTGLATIASGQTTSNVVEFSFNCRYVAIFIQDNTRLNGKTVTVKATYLDGQTPVEVHERGVSATPFTLAYASNNGYTMVCPQLEGIKSVQFVANSSVTGGNADIKVVGWG